MSSVWTYRQNRAGAWEAWHANGTHVKQSWPTEQDARAFVESIGGERATPTRRFKPVCGKGHEMTPDNTLDRSGGRGRKCRRCHYEYHNDYQKRRRAEVRETKAAWYDWVVVDRCVTGRWKPGRVPTLAEAEAIVARTWHLEPYTVARRCGVSSRTVERWRARWPQPTLVTA